jgi:hypothetical protein
MVTSHSICQLHSILESLYLVFLYDEYNLTLLGLGTPNQASHEE